MLELPVGGDEPVPEPDGGVLPVDMLPEPEPLAPAWRLSRQRVFSAAFVIALQACSCWLRDCVPAEPAPLPVVPIVVPPGREPELDGEVDVCASATLLTRAAAAIIAIVLYMRYLQGSVAIGCTTAPRTARSSVATTNCWERSGVGTIVAGNHYSAIARGNGSSSMSDLVSTRVRHPPFGGHSSHRPAVLTLAGLGFAVLALRRPGVVGLAASAASALLLAQSLRLARRSGSLPLAMSHSITIACPRKALYRFWRNAANLPEIIDGLQRVEVMDSWRARWVMDAPLGQAATWEAQIVEDAPYERIAWLASDGSGNGGWVEFRDTGIRRGTEVRALIVAEPPIHDIGSTVATVFRREPGEQARNALANLKSRFEGC